VRVSLLWILECQASEVIFKALIDPFGLTITLRVIGTTKFQFHSQGFEQIMPKLASKNSVPISDDSQWKSMQLENMINKQLNNYFCCERMA
jgi:hypothetical protein